MVWSIPQFQLKSPLQYFSISRRLSQSKFKKIKSILHKNNYPPNMINSCIEKSLYHLSLKTLSTNTKPHQPLRIIPTHTQTTQTNLAAGQRTVNNTQAPPKYMALPYVQGVFVERGRNRPPPCTLPAHGFFLAPLP